MCPLPRCIDSAGVAAELFLCSAVPAALARVYWPLALLVLLRVGGVVAVLDPLSEDPL